MRNLTFFGAGDVHDVVSISSQVGYSSYQYLLEGVSGQLEMESVAAGLVGCVRHEMALVCFSCTPVCRTLREKREGGRGEREGRIGGTRGKVKE